jgi:hypothetical protein
MAFDEDLSVFFETDDFADEVEIRDGANALVRTADVIFNSPTQEAAIFDEAVAASSPFIQGRTADILDLRDGWSVKRGAKTYRVSGAPVDEGTGTTVVYLKP